MLDEWVERVVDDLCERIPAYMRPRMIVLSDSGLGWRFNLYAGTAFRAVASLIDQVHTDEGLERFLQDKFERGEESLYTLQRIERAYIRAMERVGLMCQNGCFAAALFLMLLAALGVCATGGALVAACAASLALLWLSIAMEEGYAPVSSGVRQQYVAAALLRGACMLPLLFRYFAQYVRWGIPSNVVLQSAMAVTLFIHLAFFFPMIAFNKRQPLFLRALAGVLGAVPALTVAAALAATFSAFGAARHEAIGAVLGTLGTMLTFAGEQTASLVTLGGVRFKRQDVFLFVFTMAGFALILAGAWLAATP